MERPDGALRALDTIVEQGEDSPCDRDDSRYRTFRSIRDEHERLAESQGAARVAERADVALAGLAEELAGMRTTLAERLGSTGIARG